MVNVIGLGYIGLPTALMLSSHGVTVIGTDYNKELVETLNAGKTTFKETGLDDLFQSALQSGISFTTDYQITDTYIVSVPTPYDKFSKKVDAVYVVSAVEKILQYAPNEATIVVESTISPGTIEKSIRPILEKAKRLDIHLVHAPERIKTAEMTKVVENTFRAVNIAFANELAKICRHNNMNIYEIIKICNMHPRVNILQPGPGVGGHCISVDPWFLVGDYPSLANVINEAMKTNDGMPEFVLNRIHEIMKENEMFDCTRVGLYGLTYKENVDDMRESPTLQLLESQERHLASGLKVYDPFIINDVVPNQYHSLDTFLDAVDLVVIMVKHDEIKENIEKLKGKIILDCQNICNLDRAYHI